MSKVMYGVTLASVSFPAFAGGGGMGSPHTMPSLLLSAVALVGITVVTRLRRTH